MANDQLTQLSSAPIPERLCQNLITLIIFLIVMINSWALLIMMGFNFSIAAKNSKVNFDPENTASEEELMRKKMKML